MRARLTITPSAKAATMPTTRKTRVTEKRSQVAERRDAGSRRTVSGIRPSRRAKAFVAGLYAEAHPGPMIASIFGKAQNRPARMKAWPRACVPALLHPMSDPLSSTSRPDVDVAAGGAPSAAAPAKEAGARLERSHAAARPGAAAPMAPG